MNEPGFYRSSRWFYLCLSLAVLCGITSAQTIYPEEEIHVHNLPSLTARSHNSEEVLLASLEMVIQDKEICCGKDSALQDSALAADSSSLADIARRLNGRHLLADGRPIKVKAEHLSLTEASPGYLISTILNQHALLLQWNSHLYVVHGLTYLRTVDNVTGATTFAIHKILLMDARFSDSRRNIVFNRDNDDVSKIQGFLFVQAGPE